MIFKSNNQECFVWAWLPQQQDPIVVGKLALQDKKYQFVYSANYRNNVAAISLSPFELPLEKGTFIPHGIQIMPSCLRDASPDAWGRRLLHYEYPQNDLNELDVLLLSGSNRIGNLDFQLSAHEYVPRDTDDYRLETIEILAKIAENQRMVTLPTPLALLHATSIGGARPKCIVKESDTQYIAKFSLSTDLYPMIKAEYIAMRLAKLLDINAANVVYKNLFNKDVLLVERFDRSYVQTNTYRHGILSGLSLLGLDEMEAHYASYVDLADTIRHRFDNPRQSLLELFKRLSFNVLIGNTDDHARNHAAFWDGQTLRLTPAYDLCPQLGVGQEATQAMAIEGKYGNFSTFANVISICDKFMLDTDEASAIVQSQIDGYKQYWHQLKEEAELSELDERQLYDNIFLNKYCLQGYTP